MAWPRPSVVQDIVQTPAGHLLFAGVSGLVRFDGISFVDVAVPGTRSVRRVLAASDGSMWVALGAAKIGRNGTYPGQIRVGFREGAGGLVRIKGDETQIIWPADGKAEHWVWALTETADHQIWIGTEAGLFRMSSSDPSASAVWLGDRFAHVPMLVSSLQPAASADEVWVGGSDGVYLVNGHGQRKLWNDPVLDVTAHLDTAFVATDDDVFALHSNTSATAPARLGLQKFGPPLTLAADSNAGVWVAYAKQLVHASFVRAPESFALADAVPHTKMFVDREGSVWMGTAGVGSIQSRPCGVRNLWSGNGLDGDVAFSVLRAHDDAVWVRTDVGMQRFFEGESQTFRFDDGFPAWAPGPLSQDGAGRLWVSAGTRLQQAPSHGFTAMTTAATASVRSLMVDHEGKIWGSGSDGGLFRFAAENPATVELSLVKSDGLCPGYIAHVAEGPPGTLWAAGNQGLSRVQNGGARCFAAAEGFVVTDLTSALPTESGRVWITAVGDVGLFLFDGKKAIAFGTTSGMPRGSLFFAVDDHKGSLWFTSDHGVFLVSQAELMAWAGGGPAVHVQRFGVEDGLRSEHAMAAFPPGAVVARDGVLWVPTLAGLSLVAPPSQHPKVVATPVLESVVVDGAALSLTESQKHIGPNVGQMEFRFSAPSFVNPGRLRFEHRLIGAEHAWSQASEARVATYARLPAGNYQFQLRIAAQASPTQSLSFTVVPHFFETNGFRLFCLFLVAGAALALHRTRTARIRARFALLQTERARIARDLHDGLAQVFLGLGFHLDSLRICLGDTAPEQVAKLADGARDLLDRAQAEVRSAVWTLRTEFGDDVLRRSLTRLGIQSTKTLGVDVKVDVGEAVPPVSGLLEQELPAIAREAITNAVNHGQARKVKVSLEITQEALVLTVADDGKGLLQAGGGGSGFGWIGMRERAHRLGAELSVSPGTQGGTIVIARIPRSALNALAK
ncbi:MAG: histidine kinase [Deltaproteobacteria bacterium]|nr:histidine kinase [Deltaproteobacteria bacterium]